jgi:hypothetical protein
MSLSYPVCRYCSSENATALTLATNMALPGGAHNMSVMLCTSACSARGCGFAVLEEVFTQKESRAARLMLKGMLVNAASTPLLLPSTPLMS